MRGQRVVDPEKNYLINFAVRWVHFGGGSTGEIFVTFGITPAEYFRRLLDALDPALVSPALYEQISTVARLRLYLQEPTSADSDRW